MNLVRTVKFVSVFMCFACYLINTTSFDGLILWLSSPVSCLNRIQKDSGTVRGQGSNLEANTKTTSNFNCDYARKYPCNFKESTSWGGNNHSAGQQTFCLHYRVPKTPPLTFILRQSTPSLSISSKSYFYSLQVICITASSGLKGCHNFSSVFHDIFVLTVCIIVQYAGIYSFYSFIVHTATTTVNILKLIKVDIFDKDLYTTKSWCYGYTE
jgi:hypothetical protein